MSVMANARGAASLAIVMLIVACGGAAAPTSSPTAVATARPTPSAATGALNFTVDSSSKATVRVREQLARIPAPSDAVLTATGVTGTFAFNSDGTFAPSSKISVDLTTLTSDQAQRDQFVKRDPLEVSKFPSAEFVPTKASGLTLPLAASGDFTLKLVGNMTIHGVTKEVTFDVTGNRAGSKLTATATAQPTWKFGDFGMKPPSSAAVLSVVDEIKLEIALVANETKA